MPYTFKSGQPIKTDPKTGKLLGGTYTPPGQEEEPEAVEGDPEQAKAMARAFGMPWAVNMIDKANAGENPFSSNVTVNTDQAPFEKRIKPATTGDYAEDGFVTVEEKVNEVIGDVFRANTGSLPFDNPLEEFNSMNCIFGLGCLSPEELNYPDKTYRRKGLKYGQIVLKSGQTPIGKPRIYAEKKYGIDTGYYIDNVEIQTVIAPNPRSRATNFFNLTFQVTEPLSMGLFLQTLQKCSRNAGYQNYLEAPWLLTLDFNGYTDTGEIIKAKTGAIRKMFPLKLVSIDFDVTTSGSVYNVTCSVYNDEALTDAAQGLPVDVTISGRTIKEMTQTGLNSLATHINTHLLKQREEQNVKHEIDEYIFVFPTDTSSKGNTIFELAGGLETSTATTGDLSLREFDDQAVTEAFDTANSEGSLTDYEAFFEQQAQSMDPNLTTVDIKRDFIEGRLGYSVKRGRLSEGIKKILAGKDVVGNAIGESTVDPGNPLASGNVPFGLANFAWNQETGLLERRGTTIDPKLRSIQFRKGTKIQKILEELVLMSDYGKELSKQFTTKTNGMVNWFRVEANMFLVKDPVAEKALGRLPRIYVYRVVPYEVHSSIFQMPNDPPPGYDKLLEQACKKYDYIYTGFNKNVLNFDIKFDNAFYQSIGPDVGNRSASNDASEQSNTDSEPNKEVAINPGVPQGDGNTLVREDGDTDFLTAGAVTEDPDLRTARKFNEAIVNAAADLISIEMEILGDPYFIADSGVGNYNSEGTSYININSDGSINHQSGEVDVIINFRTPVDMDPETGGYKLNGASIGLGDFSGLYKVNEVTNTFRGNMFKQILSCVRRRNFQNASQGDVIKQRAIRDQENHERRVEEARENGTAGDVEFALADANGDGVLQYWEVPDPDKAAALAAGRSNPAPSSNTPPNNESTSGSQTDVTTTSSENETSSESSSETTTSTETVTVASGSVSGSVNDIYFKYGGGGN